MEKACRKRRSILPGRGLEVYDLPVLVEPVILPKWVWLDNEHDDEHQQDTPEEYDAEHIPSFHHTASETLPETTNRDPQDRAALRVRIEYSSPLVARRIFPPSAKAAEVMRRVFRLGASKPMVAPGGSFAEMPATTSSTSDPSFSISALVFHLKILAATNMSSSFAP